MAGANTEIYFFDTYALIEIVKGAPAYKKYLNSTIVTTKLNLMELYYALARDFDKEIADKFYDFCSAFAASVDDRTIKNAMLFKLHRKGERLSYVDCIGYVFALENGIRFLTGDRKFRDKKNVESTC